MGMMATMLDERVEELRRDREHGASWMARRAVEALVALSAEDVPDSAALVARLRSAGRELAASRPGVGAVAGAAGRLLAAANRASHLPPDELRRLIEEEARALLAQRDRASASIAIQLAPRLTDAFVLTHSASATVRAALLRTPPQRVTCTASEPLGEGRAFAAELEQAGLAVELVEDEDAVAALEHASLLLVGADTVFRDGTLYNKIGTRRLAQAASDLNVPTVVACEVIKLAPFDASDAPELEVDARTLFDLTSPELVDEIVTEEGTYWSDDVGALIDRTPFLAEGYRLLGPLTDKD